MQSEACQVLLLSGIIHRLLQSFSRSKKDFRIGFHVPTWSEVLRTLIPQSRGVVTIPYLKGLSEQFRRTANRVAFKPGKKVKEIKPTCQEPLGERQKCVVYKISCACQNTVYVGETWRLFPNKEERTHGQSQTNN